MFRTLYVILCKQKKLPRHHLSISKESLLKFQLFQHIRIVYGVIWLRRRRLVPSPKPGNVNNYAALHALSLTHPVVVSPSVYFISHRRIPNLAQHVHHNPKSGFYRTVGCPHQKAQKTLNLTTVPWTCQEKCSRETPKVWNWMKFETERSIAEWSFKFRRLLMRPAPAAFCERPPAASRPDCSCRLEAGCSK